MSVDETGTNRREREQDRESERRGRNSATVLCSPLLPFVVSPWYEELCIGQLLDSAWRHLKLAFHSLDRLIARRLAHGDASILAHGQEVIAQQLNAAAVLRRVNQQTAPRVKKNGKGRTGTEEQGSDESSNEREHSAVQCAQHSTGKRRIAARSEAGYHCELTSSRLDANTAHTHTNERGSKWQNTTKTKTEAKKKRTSTQLGGPAGFD